MSATPETNRFLRRALIAEDELESARERVAELESHMAAIIRGAADPLLVARAERSEELLQEVMSAGFVACTPEWMTRVRAQLVAVNIYNREDL